ncbi:hypothetical protein PR048_016586 [Dryococelus australis]|uniref:Uncharacterized protein n=1 Tax=Dryococelus australis TaxID=614101 RepID=A0ABQ9H775_9NEOP|nr:hypothetical protein PR048_016586 [Dryococelus australis]
MPWTAGQWAFTVKSFPSMRLNMHFAHTSSLPLALLFWVKKSLSCGYQI